MGELLSLVLSHKTEHALSPFGVPGLYLWDLKTCVPRIWRLAAFVVSAHSTQRGRSSQRVQKLVDPYGGVLRSGLKCILLRIPTILFPLHDWKPTFRNNRKVTGGPQFREGMKHEWAPTSSAVSSAKCTAVLFNSSLVNTHKIHSTEGNSNDTHTFRRTITRQY